MDIVLHGRGDSINVHPDGATVVRAGDTLVIFSSDNGGVLQTSGDQPETKAYEAGLRVNGEWRGRKHSIYQGGFRVPFLARWPGKVRAGTTSGATINLVDMLATVAAKPMFVLIAPLIGERSPK